MPLSDCCSSLVLHDYFHPSNNLKEKLRTDVVEHCTEMVLEL
jgi:hypothetical protein